MFWFAWNTVVGWVAQAASESCSSLSDEQVVAALGAAMAVRSGTEAVTASLVGQAETRGVRAQQAQASTAGRLRRRFQVSPREATGSPRWRRCFGNLDPLAGAEVREVLEVAARPVDAVDGIRDERNREQCLADALVEW